MPHAEDPACGASPRTIMHHGGDALRAGAGPRAGRPEIHMLISASSSDELLNLEVRQWQWQLFWGRYDTTLVQL